MEIGYSIVEVFSLLTPSSGEIFPTGLVSSVGQFLGGIGRVENGRGGVIELPQDITAFRQLS